MKKTKSLTCVILAVILFYSLPVLARNELMEANFGEPNMQDTNVVDINLAKFAALQYAEKFYGDDYSAPQVYNIETYYDLVNQPAVYAIILTSTEDQIPILEELRTEVQHKYSAIKQIKESLLLIDSEPISGKAKSKLISGVRIQIKELEKQLRQSDRFITILCGATEQHVPVIRAYRGLPEHLTLLPDIQQVLQADSELMDYQPGRIYYLGLFDLGYSLEKDSVQKNALEIDEQKVISIKNKTVRTKTEMANERDARKAERDSVKEQQSLEMQMAANERLQEREIKIKEKWQRLKKRYEKQKKTETFKSSSNELKDIEKVVPISDELKKLLKSHSKNVPLDENGEPIRTPSPPKKDAKVGYETPVKSSATQNKE